MNYLFIDASHSLTVGLLNSDWDWINFETSSDLPSVSLHKTIDKYLGDKGWDNISGLFFNKGPGSYTGLRLIEGFEQYLRYEGVKCYDFYSFELKSLLGLSQEFIYSAFKGEFLVYGDDGKLINKSNVDTDKEYYGDKLPEEINSKSIINLIKNNSKSIFPNILNNEAKEIYYFRPLSEEFKK